MKKSTFAILLKLMLNFLLNTLIGALTTLLIAGPIYLLKTAPSNVQVIVKTVIISILIITLFACVGSIIRALWGVMIEDEEYYPPSY